MRTRRLQGGAGSGAEPRPLLDPGESAGQIRRITAPATSRGAPPPPGRGYADSEASLSTLALESLDETADRLSSAGRTREASRLLAEDRQRRSVTWADALPPTRTGTPRRVRLALCGVAVPFMAPTGLAVGWDRRGCRDRLCWVCAAKRSRETAAVLRQVAAGREVAFVTLTQPALPGEGVRCALDRLLAAWRHLLRRLRRQRPSGWRSCEVTLRSPRGSLRPHAHLHVLWEGDGEALVRAWLAVACGAKREAQDWRTADERAVGQCAKYSVKPAGLAEMLEAGSPLASEACEAVANRKLAGAFGTWRAAVAAARKRPPGRTYGSRSLLTIHLGDVKFGAHGTLPWSEVVAALPRAPGSTGSLAPPPTRQQTAPDAAHQVPPAGTGQRRFDSIDPDARERQPPRPRR